MIREILHYSITGFVAIVLVACSAGGGETGTGQNPDTVTVGVITGFGSVFVNGKKYETDSNTSINIDGSDSTESKLQVGMIVTLTGSTNSDGSNSALSITFDDNVEGMVLENTVADNNQFIILGQTIIVDDFDTVFESQVSAISTLEQIQVGNIVEVSGHTTGDGVIYATRIELKREIRGENDEIELEGVVANHLSQDQTFQVGSMTIDYSMASFKDLTTESIKNGDYVEVTSDADLQNNQLIAATIELKKRHKEILAQTTNQEVEMEGVITKVESATEFSLNGQEIVINNLTKISDINEIQVGKKAKVEGYISAGQRIVASEIEVKKENKTKIEGLISAIDTDSKTITVYGVVITITSSTTVKDERDNVSDNERHFFNFNDLSIGNKVEVSFYRDEDLDKNIATKLELEDGESDEDKDGGSGSSEENEDSEEKDWELKNIISSYDAEEQTIIVLGRTIDISRVESLISSDPTGKLAEVKGVIVNDIWVATEFEVEDEENESTEKSEKEDQGFIL